jgi:hypothetical protein
MDGNDDTTGGSTADVVDCNADDFDIEAFITDWVALILRNPKLRSIAVTRLVDALSCPEMFRGKSLGLRSPLTKWSVLGDATHKLVAGIPESEVREFVAHRWARKSEDEREEIMREAVRMAANAGKTALPQAKPATSERHLEWKYMGWVIHSQPDRIGFTPQGFYRWRGPGGVRKPKPKILDVVDSKTTKSVKDHHWLGLIMHAVVAKNFFNHTGPVRMTIEPLGESHSRPESRFLSRTRYEGTMDRIKAALWELEELWKQELTRLMRIFLERGMVTTKLRQAMIDEPFRTLSDPMFRKIIEEEEVSSSNAFRPKAGRQCEQCKRLSRCSVGREFVEHERAVRAEREAFRIPIENRQPLLVTTATVAEPAPVIDSGPEQSVI